MKKLLMGAAIAVASMATAAMADGHANYPERPVMLMVSYGAGGATDFADKKIGSTKIYNVALTADEVLTNYNTQKSLYGL